KQVIAVFYLFLIPASVAAEQNFSKLAEAAHKLNQAMPHLSQIAPATTPQQAYALQKQWTAKVAKSDPISGYKAGLTSKAGQAKFAVSEALSGVLFASGSVRSPYTVNIEDAGKLMLETELGFILAKSVNKPIESSQQLNKIISKVVAVIELPDLAYKNPKSITGIDLIGANVASHQFLLGKKLNYSDIAINQIRTQLKHQGKTLVKGKAIDALGDQKQALIWLINHLLSHGFQLNQGQLLITGALGKMVPAKTGDYSANFGELGNINFQIIKKPEASNGH
ncbi:MAG: hypothetical protein OQK04_11680, partial [Kangiellaceae bacterium]|nr:hypothetical protein [Kangiellaceae bacterium]